MFIQYKNSITSDKKKSLRNFRYFIFYKKIDIFLNKEKKMNATAPKNSYKHKLLSLAK